jgi:hypothetical protein
MALGVPAIALRRALLHLHKTVLDWARLHYERRNGAVSSQQMLHLLLSDPQFAWLRPLSEIIVRLDEALETDVVAREADLAAVVDELRRLIGAAGGETPFGDRYRAAMQDSPDVVLAHRDVARLLAPPADRPPPTTAPPG